MSKRRRTTSSKKRIDELRREIEKRGGMVHVSRSECSPKIEQRFLEHVLAFEVRIFEYVDREIPMLARMFEKRLRGYRAIGYAQVEVPPGYEGPRNKPMVERDDEAFPRFDDWT